MIKKTINTLCLIALICTFAHKSYAADTIEVLPKNVFETEGYISTNSNEEISTEIGAHFGVLDTATMHLHVQTLFANDINPKELSVLYGWYGTPIDSDHIDLDLFLDVRYQRSENTNAIGSTVGLELNIDSLPELAGAGMYMRPHVDFSGLTNLDTVEISTTFGIYFSASKNLQLLFEETPTYDTKSIDINVTCGANYTIFDNAEVLIEASTNLIGKEIALMVGFIIDFE